jgi:hypothetical protein
MTLHLPIDSYTPFASSSYTSYFRNFRNFRNFRYFRYLRYLHYFRYLRIGPCAIAGPSLVRTRKDRKTYTLRSGPSCLRDATARDPLDLF